jgi:hypothetical protein
VLLALAIAAGAIGWLGGGDAARGVETVAQQARKAAATVEGFADRGTRSAAPPAAAPERSTADRDWFVRPARRSEARTAAPTPVPTEPQWDGRGTPGREWLAWQLETLAAQANPNGGVSRAALDAAIADAIAAREAKQAMAQAPDPEALVVAQERFEAAARSLAENLGVESVDLSAF